MRSRKFVFPYWARTTLLVGGILLAAGWAAFTLTHGPTSYNRGGSASHFWSALLALPNLLIALGVFALRPSQWTRPRVMSVVGYRLALFGLMLWALTDLTSFVPIGPLVTGVGLVLFSLASYGNAPWSRSNLNVLLVSGLFMISGSLAYFLVPLEVADTYGSFRIFGFTAYFVPAILWVALALTLRTSKSTTAHLPGG